MWWALKTLFDRGLLYQGHKIVWWWAQGGTALSSGEVGQGYREVADPSVYVRFPLVDDAGKPTVRTRSAGLDHDALDAAEQPVRRGQAGPGILGRRASTARRGKLVIASALVEPIAAEGRQASSTVEAHAAGQRPGRLALRAAVRLLLQDAWATRPGPAQGRRHGSTLPGGSSPADFVTIDTGTGIVHQAPAFGEVDFDVLLAEQARFVDGEGPQLICAVAPDGTFTAEAPDYQGRWVKDCDRDIIRDLKAPRPALPPGAIPARLSVLLAGRGRSADPVSAEELVHPHHAVQATRCWPTTA